MHKRFDTYGYWVGITVGLCITYTAGVLQLSFISNTPFRVILWGMLPLLLMDLLKAIAAYTVAYPITKVLKQLIPNTSAKEG